MHYIELSAVCAACSRIRVLSRLFIFAICHCLRNRWGKNKGGVQFESIVFFVQSVVFVKFKLESNPKSCVFKNLLNLLDICVDCSLLFAGTAKEVL